MKFVDLFAGAGGLSLGLEMAGLTGVLAVEIDESAAKTYSKNFGHKCLVQDVRVLTGRDIIDEAGCVPDILAGGPPCQGFSTIGKRNKHDERNSLVGEFIRLAAELSPKIVLIENVLGLKDMDFVPHIEKALSDIGYNVTHHILTSADYGVPQLRRRIIFVGSKSGGRFLPPIKTHDSSNYVSVEQAISDLPVIHPGQKIVDYTCPPSNEYQALLRVGSTILQGHEASKHTKELVEAISYIPDGGNRLSIPEHLQPSSGFHNSYSRLNSKEPAVAITQNMAKPSGTRCIHPFQNRGLTAREGARLQSFPDSFHFIGGATSQRLQVANAVPPLLAKAIGGAIVDPLHWVF
ncbi:DNA cytosine methyltransferase [Aeromonas veronii]|uniref:DNA cytosine methyltransferase n=1 Tax=Aeromonas veronii TaxID=654 RepID=UPI003BA354FA